MWLNEAIQYAENDKQAAALRNLVAYYETGDLEWSLYNINWVQDTEGDVDYINGFVEVYNDPGYTVTRPLWRSKTSTPARAWPH